MFQHILLLATRPIELKFNTDQPLDKYIHVNNDYYVVHASRMTNIAIMRIFGHNFKKIFISRIKAGLQIRVHILKLFSLFLIQNICCGYSKEPFQ